VPFPRLPSPIGSRWLPHFGSRDIRLERFVVAYADAKRGGNFGLLRKFPRPTVVFHAGLTGAKKMDKKIAGLLGAVGALATLDTAQATVATDPTTLLTAQSYAALLEPIPDAAATLKAIDHASVNGTMRVAANSHHHHHHYRRRHHHHHHHHHHH
jgi:hypothetical protein